MQQVKDKNNKIEEFSRGNEISIELGPGTRRFIKNAITIDKFDSDAVDIVADLEQGLTFIPDNSVSYIYSSHLMEHVQPLEGLLKEVYRILKQGGRYEFVVPHFANPYFYSDYTHKNFFGLYTMSYFSKSPYFKRKVPQFYNTFDFTIEKVKLEFTSPFVSRYPFKKMFQLFFNVSKWMQELHEEIFCYIIPVYQIRFVISKKEF
jgi:predicted SAM-dependent methyltransferase